MGRMNDYVRQRVAILINTFIAENTSDEAIKAIVLQLCKESDMPEDDYASAIKSAVTTTKMMRLKRGEDTPEKRKEFFLEVITPMLDAEILPSSAEHKLREHFEHMPLSSEYTEELVAEYYNQFNAKYTFDIVVSVIDCMVSANKSETQIYNIVIVRAVDDFKIDNTSELYKRLEAHIETQLQLRQDGKIRINTFEFSSVEEQKNASIVFRIPSLS